MGLEKEQTWTDINSWIGAVSLPGGKGYVPQEKELPFHNQWIQQASTQHGDLCAFVHWEVWGPNFWPASCLLPKPSLPTSLCTLKCSFLSLLSTPRCSGSFALALSVRGDLKGSTSVSSPCCNVACNPVQFQLASLHPAFYLWTLRNIWVRSESAARA